MSRKGFFEYASGIRTAETDLCSRIQEKYLQVQPEPLYACGGSG